MKLASFDIFDTVLIRKCGAPENIFCLLAKKLFQDQDAQIAAFTAWRNRAERDACQKLKHRNVSFEQIYETFDEESFRLTRQEAAEAEKCVERDNLIVNPAVKGIIEAKRDAGYRICFISDMYFDSGFLRTLLEANEVILPEEELFVSSEYGARKSDGRLFEIAREKYNPDRWEHYGDNRTSDYARPKKQGIKAFGVDTDYTEAERTILHRYKNHRFVHELSVFIGFQRAARLSRGDNSFTELAADFVAAAYIPYVLYVLDQARKNQIKRLYFINRDGYILMKIAEMFSDQYPEIELRYIFISRKSIISASFVELKPSLLFEVLNSQTLIGKNPHKLSAYLNLSPELLSKHGIGFDYNRIVTSEQEEDFLNKIFNSDFTPVFEQITTESRAVFKEYLDQEQVTENITCAMVDIGWIGSTRLMLNRILNHYGHPDIPFFYYSVLQDVIPNKYGAFYCYTHPRMIEGFGLFACLEQYFSACPYNTVNSYKKENGKIIPLFEESAQTAGYSTIISENIRTTEAIVSYMDGFPDIDFTRILDILNAEYLGLLKTQRVKINLEACLSAGNFTDPVLGSQKAFVKKVNIRETILYAFLGEHITAFDKGSIALTYGVRFSKFLFFIHRYTAKLRLHLYNRYVIRKKN